MAHVKRLVNEKNHWRRFRCRRRGRRGSGHGQDIRGNPVEVVVRRIRLELVDVLTQKRIRGLSGRMLNKWCDQDKRSGESL